uniref:Voltage-dependent calcium channel subunit alpha-2/delta-1 n=1 Tax=Schistosoma haematobium TaxID=6185 RepID=A0A095CCJ8_SCHHA
MKINYHVFNLETANEHMILHKDEDDQVNVETTLVDEEEGEYKIINRGETVMEDKEEQQRFNASISLNDEFISMENELLSLQLNDSFCVNNTNCLSQKPFQRKLIIRSTLSSNNVNDESGNIPDIKNFNGSSSIILTDQTIETTKALQSSESITPLLSSRFETSVGVSEIGIDDNKSLIPIENTKSVDNKPIINEVNISVGFENTTIATTTTTVTTSATSVLLTSPDGIISQTTLDTVKDEVNVNNDGVESDQIISEQNNELRNFLAKIQSINSNQTELLSQILLEIIIAERDVTESAESIKLKSPILSRTIALNTGVIWTIPIKGNPVVTEDNSNSLLQGNTKQINDNDTINITAQTSENQLQITPTTTKSTINITEEEQNVNQVDGSKNIHNRDKVIDDHKHSHIEIDEYFDESLPTVSEDESIENVELINQTMMNTQDNTALPVTIFTSITITQGPNVYKAGVCYLRFIFLICIKQCIIVMGITLEPDYLSEQLNMIPECSVTQSNKLCYLLEDAANIIAVNNKLLYYQIGQFLGHIDPDLMNSLVQNHVYGVLKDYDFEGTCYPREDMLETTSPGIHPIPSILTYTQSLFSVRIWLDRLLTIGSVSAFITRAFIVGLIRVIGNFKYSYRFCLFSVALNCGLTVEILLYYIISGDLNDYVDPQNKPYQCIKLMHRYYSLNSELYDTINPPFNDGFHHRFQGLISCSQQRNRDWSVQSINGTNLLLLITDPIFAECEKITLIKRLRRDPVKDVGPDVCETSRVPRYRRQSQKWTLVPNDEDNPLHCSSTDRLQISLYMIMILNVFSFIVLLVI